VKSFVEEWRDAADDCLVSKKGADMSRSSAAVLIALFAWSCGGSMRAPVVTPSSDDPSLVARVRTALLNDPVVHGNEVNVTAENGIVVLTGQVHGEQEATAAIAIARRTTGVKDVRSELQTNR
jgi:hyperosmotically inducible protein